MTPTPATFSIDAYWPRRSRRNERDVAEIAIRHGDRSLTTLFEAETGTVRDFFRASAVSLGMWLADNWWRLRWEPIADYRAIGADWRLRHEISSAPGGTLWPPLMVYGVGERVVIAPVADALPSAGPVEYRATPVSLLSGSAYEQGVDTFLSRVLSACSTAQDADALEATLGQLNAERRDDELAGWRRLEARLGYDPDSAPEGLMERLLIQEARVGSDGVEEAAIGSPGESAPVVLEQTMAATESGIVVDLEAAALAGGPVIRDDPARPTWMLAEDAAARLRRAVGRPEGPLLNRALSEILGVSWKTAGGAAPTARHLPYGARLRGDGAAQRLALQTRSSHDRRFELARFLGDAVWQKGGRFGVVSRGKTDRQKFQRAFAQSLLCPFDDLRHHLDLAGPSERQIEDAARRYHVHASVVRTLLVNKGFLPRETLGDRLEAA